MGCGAHTIKPETKEPAHSRLPALKREGAQSGVLLRFVNAIAERTARVFPNVLISTLAYQYTLDAPRRAIDVHPNVRIRLCPIRCCQGHPFGECDDPNSGQFLRAFRKWARRTKQTYIWHYTTDFRHFPLPMPNFDELQGNIDFYHRHGVHGDGGRVEPTHQRQP